MEPNLVFGGNQRKPFHEGFGKDAGTAIADQFALFVDRYALSAATGRFTLKNEAAQCFLFECGQTYAGPFEHTLGAVNASANRDEAWRRKAFYKPHGFPGDGETIFNLRTHGHPIDVLAERTYDKIVALMPAVVPDLVPQQAGAYSQPLSCELSRPTPPINLNNLIVGYHWYARRRPRIGLGRWDYVSAV